MLLSQHWKHTHLTSSTLWLWLPECIQQLNGHLQPQLWDVLLAEGALNLGTLQQLLGILTYKDSTTASIMLRWNITSHCDFLPAYLNATTVKSKQSKLQMQDVVVELQK